MPGVQAVESVRIHWLGHELRAEAEVISDAELTLAAAHDIAEEAHHRLLHDIRRLGQATIHSSPCGHDGRDLVETGGDGVSLWIPMAIVVVAGGAVAARWIINRSALVIGRGLR